MRLLAQNEGLRVDGRTLEQVGVSLSHLQIGLPIPGTPSKGCVHKHTPTVHCASSYVLSAVSGWGGS